MIIDLNGGKRLDFFKNLYEESKSALQDVFEKMKQNYEQYKGSKKIDGSNEEATHVWNITYELTESQVTTYIPSPSVSPKMISDNTERNAKSIESLLRNKRDELSFEKMNDLDERYTYIYGGSVWLIEFDNSIVTHNSVGDIKITCLSPTHFVGQPNIYDTRDMEYCFLTFETTKESVMKRYNVSLDVVEDLDSEESTDDKTATLYVCYFKDENGKICEYIWSGDTELKYVEDYYARKRKICKKCGKREELCTCEKPVFELQNEEYEEIDRDIPLTNGGVIPAMS